MPEDIVEVMQVVLLAVRTETVVLDSVTGIICSVVMEDEAVVADFGAIKVKAPMATITIIMTATATAKPVDIPFVISRIGAAFDFLSYITG